MALAEALPSMKFYPARPVFLADTLYQGSYMSSPNDDPWLDLLSDLGVDASAAPPPPPPPVAAKPAAPRPAPAAPKPVAPAPAADWNSLAADLGVSVTNAGASQPAAVVESKVSATVSVGGVEIVRAVRGPGDTEPPLMGGVSTRSSEEREAESGEGEAREQRPRSERGDSERGGRGGREQGGRGDRGRDERGGRGGRDRGGRDRGGDRSRGEGRGEPRSEQGRGDQGRGRDDRGHSGSRPVEPVEAEARTEREAEPRSAESRGTESRSTESRGEEPRRGGRERGGRDRGDRSRGQRDQQRDSRRPQGQREEPRPPVSETPRPAESRRYRDDEDDDLDDLRAPLRSSERPGEPLLDSSQASRKLWDDDEPPAGAASSFDVFGIIDEKFGGPPAIERHAEAFDEDSHREDRLSDDSLGDDAPDEPRSAGEGEREASGDRPRRRRRRRGGRSGRRADGSSRSTPRADSREGREPLDPEASGDVAPGTESSEDAPRTGRRRRRRRSGRSRDDKSPRAVSGDDDVRPALDDAEDLAPIRSREAHPHEDDDAEDQHHKHLHRDVTPWKEAIGFLVSANMENRSRSPKNNERRGYRGGRDRG